MRAIVLLLLLSACISAEELARLDHASCTGYGLVAGTPAYADCRIRFVEIREANRRAIIAGGQPSYVYVAPAY